MFNALHNHQIICDRIKIDNNQAIKDLFFNKTVFITGGAGSIGRKLCEKVIKFRPEKIVILDSNELSLFTMSYEFAEEIKENIVYLLLGSILDYTLIEHICQQYRPNIIIHAAAYKHVPIAENNPSEAIRCNVLGALNMLNAAMAFKIKHFIYLSSDKAVNPTSIMGATKRIGEIMVKYFDSLTPNNYIIVRFGNVCQSSGSVSEIFIEQLITKKEITITHPDMERYFMSINDAVSLILSSSVLYDEGNLFLCDMKQSIKIVDLARKIMTMLDIACHEVKIQYTSVRDGESLYEDLFYSNEMLRKTTVENIYLCESQDDCENILENVYDLLQHLYAKDLIYYIRKIVPQYKNEEKVYREKRDVINA